MAYANVNETVQENNVKIKTAMPETYVMVNSVNDEGIDFTVFYYDRESRYFVRRGETIEYKVEGNAAGFELYFSIVE